MFAFPTAALAARSSVERILLERVIELEAALCRIGQVVEGVESTKRLATVDGLLLAMSLVRNETKKLGDSHE